MTMRQLGETAIKMFGVYYAIATVLGLVRAIASLAVPQIEGLPPASQLAAMNLVGVVTLGVVSGVCLLRANAIAGILFSDERVVLNHQSRRDWLFLGICLVGLIWAASGVPEIMKAIGKAIWYAEGSRQSVFEGMVRNSLETVVNSALSILVGVALMLSAKRLSARLDANPDRRIASDDAG